MTDQPQKKTATPTAVIIAAALAVAVPLASPAIKLSEGKRNLTYLDIVKVPTDCYGHTGPDVKIGAWHSDAECDATLSKDVNERFGVPILTCTPQLIGHKYRTAAAIRMTYNIGVKAFCEGSPGRDFRADKPAAGCADFSKFIYAGGKVVPGLVTRRAAERAMCELDNP